LCVCPPKNRHGRAGSSSLSSILFLSLQRNSLSATKTREEKYRLLLLLLLLLLLTILLRSFFFTTTKPYIVNNLSRPWARTIYRANYRTHSRIFVYISSFFFFLLLFPLFFCKK
jgi:hypothetical protein